MAESCQLSLSLDDLLAVEHFLNYLVVRPWLLEELIVHLTTSSWINPDEVTSARVLNGSLSYVILISQASRLLQRLQQARKLHWIIVNVLLDSSLKLSCWLSSENLRTRQTNQATCSGFLRFVIKTLHPVLDLIERLLLSIKSPHTSKI